MHSGNESTISAGAIMPFSLLSGGTQLPDMKIEQAKGREVAGREWGCGSSPPALLAAA